jgi:L-fuculose-phosphate aldolase
MLLPDERAALVTYCLKMQADDLTVGTSGNLSVRSGDLVAITPSGVAYDDLTPEAICVIDVEGNVVEADLEPSSEVPMHTSVYQATDAGAVVHTHPLYCTALSVTMDEVPPVHYMIALLGGPVRVAPYARFGSPELAQGSVEAMADRTGVLLRNHGATTYGDTLDKAYTRSIYL